MFVSNPACVSAGTVYSTAIVAKPLGSRPPRLHGNPVQPPCVDETVPMTKPTGKLSSVTVTLSAIDGPLLTTVMTYVWTMPSPAVTCVSPSSLLMFRSALVRISMLSVLVLVTVSSLPTSSNRPTHRPYCPQWRFQRLMKRRKSPSWLPSGSHRGWRSTIRSSVHRRRCRYLYPLC